MGAVQLVCECGSCDRCKARERMRTQRATNPERVRAIDRARYYRNKKKRLDLAKQYHEEHREQVARHKRDWVKRNPAKRMAEIAVGNAVRDGRLTKGACAHDGPACSGRIEAHHEDYSKPLEVVWLCSSHHGETRRIAA